MARINTNKTLADTADFSPSFGVRRLVAALSLADVQKRRQVAALQKGPQFPRKNRPYLAYLGSLPGFVSIRVMGRCRFARYVDQLRGLIHGLRRSRAGFYVPPW